MKKQQLTIDLAFTLEGRVEDELQEEIIGTIRLKKVDLRATKRCNEDIGMLGCLKLPLTASDPFCLHFAWLVAVPVAKVENLARRTLARDAQQMGPPIATITRRRSLYSRS